MLSTQSGTMVKAHLGQWQELVRTMQVFYSTYSMLYNSLCVLQIQKQEEGQALCQVGDHVFTKCVALLEAVPMPGPQVVQKPGLGHL